METKQVQLVKPWGLNPKGEIVTPPVVIADLLIQSGRAKAVEPTAPGQNATKTDKGQKGSKPGK
jgi:hypothetical protein